MGLKTRVVKLESAIQTEREPINISNFIVESGYMHPAGYSCEGITIMRRAGEITEELNLLLCQTPLLIKNISTQSQNKNIIKQNQ
ncbi:MAG: hypothetical protein PHE96_03490 [Methylococcales bacterium]|nr:hypothetical protein [Methylococcales bacterium]